jgi:hypothetical protein
VTARKLSRSEALNVWYWLAVTAENNAPMPTISTTATSRVQTVERSDLNFVHSETSTLD